MMNNDDIKEAAVAAARAAKVIVLAGLLCIAVVTFFFLSSPAAWGQSWPDGISDMRKNEVRDVMWVTLVCDQWRDGYYDGYCALQEYGCMAPTTAPFCPWQSFRTTRQAYHRGYARGETDYILTLDLEVYSK